MVKFYSFLTLALLMSVSSSAFATGGFYCSDPSGLSVSGTTARMQGNPLVGDVLVMFGYQPVTSIKRNDVVGYWHSGSEFRLMAIDVENTGNKILEIRATLPPRAYEGKGKMSLLLDGIGEKMTRHNVKVVCVFE